MVKEREPKGVGLSHFKEVATPEKEGGDFREIDNRRRRHFSIMIVQGRRGGQKMGRRGMEGV